MASATKRLEALTPDGESEGPLTVVVAFCANLIVAVAKSVAASSLALLRYSLNLPTLGRTQKIKCSYSSQRNAGAETGTPIVPWGTAGKLTSGPYSLHWAFSLWAPSFRSCTESRSCWRRNRLFLIGQPLNADGQKLLISLILEQPNVARVTYIHLEWVGPGRIYLVAAVNMEGENRESTVAEELRAVAAELEKLTAIQEAVLTLALRGEPSLQGSSSPGD